MSQEYKSIQISIAEATSIAKTLYNIEGKITPLDGEIDFNFKIQGVDNAFLLKISRPNADYSYLDFQANILDYIADKDLNSPNHIPDIKGNIISEIKDHKGNIRFVRLLSWLPGRLWSKVNPHNDELLYSLGRETAKLCKALKGFEHPMKMRDFEWDIAQSHWTYNYLHLFQKEKLQIVQYFQQQFSNCQLVYNSLRKSVVHNDANDNNIIVTDDLLKPSVYGIIDYGDAVYTQLINDLAITIAYAVMNKTHVLEAAIPIVKGFHTVYSLSEEELSVLYTLVAMRLIISVTKSAINKEKEPDNTYLIISENAAWDVLKKWISFDKNFAHYCFRHACGFTAHPKEEEFKRFIKNKKFSLKELFPQINRKNIFCLDMGMESTWLGHESVFNDIPALQFKLDKLQNEHPDKILAGGYMECRPIYTSDAYKLESNTRYNFRTVHLGIDFWLPESTAVHALFDGEVVVAVNDAGYKEYGGLVILKHRENGIVFYTLYGHNSVASIQNHKKGDIIKKGDCIAELGRPNENGEWAPHSHFQIMLDLLNYKDDFPGVCIPQDKEVWASICPDPNLLFKLENLKTKQSTSKAEILKFRKKYLGKSLSLQYQNPLKIVRGKGAYLLDSEGQRYLDTVNNVAHVGHEHPAVVEAGQKQMALLNTNTRYLHDNINQFAKELLATFPKELSVVHFVNSGSEANELALRMIKAYTGQKDIIAVEMGYHGNTNACVDISSYKFDGKGGKGAPEHTHIVPLPDTFRGIYQKVDSGQKYAAHIQEQINRIENKGRKLGGFICESIISCGGQIELPDHYLKIAYEAVRNAGGLCIADEVQVGCGRVGKTFWGFQLYDVIPDIVTIGKPIGNGHPLAAVVCTQEVAETFANGMEYFNTFGGNPVSCAIGKEVLNIIKHEKLQKNALEVGNYLKNKLQKLSESFPIIGDVRGQGLFLGFELVDANRLPMTDKANYLASRMKDFGILMSTDGRDDNVLKIKPPIVFSKKNADELLLRLSTVFSEDFMKY